MRFQITFDLIERLRRESIGTPQWMPTTLTYEYAEHSARVVAILKLVRSAHGVAALEILRLNGLFIDLGMVTRGVFDSVEEVYFLLEQYQNTSRHVDQFVMKTILAGTFPLRQTMSSKSTFEAQEYAV
jgi:hypothetical protein